MTNIDLPAVQENIGRLAAIGRTGSGGISRLSYSAAWREAVDYVGSLMEEAGMTVASDAVGNLIGTLPGSDSALPYLLVGSHLDTVPEGGSLDGALGIVAALECIRAWRRSGFRPARTVRVIATVEEEGTLFGIGCLGSRFITGELTKEKLCALEDKHGKKFPAYLADRGMDHAALAHRLIDPADIYAFLELHVEQGSELHLSGQPCAIVTDIVGIDRCWITVAGEANHAGTTRMDRRKDALVAAAALVGEVYRRAGGSAGACVATVGRLHVEPGATNVIPGKVELTVETRAAADAVMEKAYADIAAFLPVLEKQYGVAATITQRRFAPAAGMSGRMIAALAAAAATVRVAAGKMPSWAGHDAKILATVTDCGMLFVPSVDGISHSPAEATRWPDVASGILVFEQAMRSIAST